MSLVMDDVRFFREICPCQVKSKSMILYSAVSSPPEAPYTSPPWQYIPTPTRLQWEEFSHVAITAVHKDCSLTCTLPLSTGRYSFIQPTQLGCCGENENGQTSQQRQRGFEPGLGTSEYARRRCVICPEETYAEK